MDRPPGIEFHAFSIVGMCRRTGRLGIGTTTRSLALGARVPPLDQWLTEHTRRGMRPCDDA